MIGEKKRLSKLLFVAILPLVSLLAFFVSIQFHRGGTRDGGKIAVTHKKESVSYADLPLPVYDLETLSLANRLVTCFNKGDAACIYDMLSRESKILYTGPDVLKPALEALKNTFGNIDRLERLKRPSPGMPLNHPDNQFPYLYSRVDDWKWHIGQG